MTVTSPRVERTVEILSTSDAPFVMKFFMVALWNRADQYIFALWFLSIFLFFFPRLISTDWMSTILLHMV